jgi:hypothetical protein
MKTNIYSALTICTVASLGVIAHTQTAAALSYQQVEQQVASSKAVDVVVYPGRISTIDFSATREYITYTGLGDRSRLVYSTDLPLDSGSSQTVFLKPIETLHFPGATTTSITNLIVKTVDNQGTTRVYNFQVKHSNSSVANLGLKIVPSKYQKDPKNAGIKISNNRTASLDDVAEGLRRAISLNYTSKNDPVVYKIRNFIAIAKNGNSTPVEAASMVQLDLAVVTALAELAFEPFTTSTPIEKKSSGNNGVVINTFNQLKTEKPSTKTNDKSNQQTTKTSVTNN